MEDQPDGKVTVFFLDIHFPANESHHFFYALKADVVALCFGVFLLDGVGNSDFQCFIID